MAALLLLVIAVGSGFAWWAKRSAAKQASAAALSQSGAALSDTSARAPHGVRVAVRVLNSSGARGQARKATLVLRDFGYDVVEYATGPDTALAQTVVQINTGRTDWAERVLKVLGTGTTATVADSSHYVDLTVLIGRDWRAPANPLRP